MSQNAHTKVNYNVYKLHVRKKEKKEKEDRKGKVPHSNEDIEHFFHSPKVPLNALSKLGALNVGMPFFSKQCFSV